MRGFIRFGRVLGVLAASLLVMGLVSGCVALIGSGRMETREYDLAGFEAIRASHGFRVEVRQGDEFEVLVTSDDNILDRLEVEVDGDVLSLGLPPGFFTTSRLEAEVTMPEIREVNASGGSRVSLDGFVEEQDAFRTVVSGGGRISGEIHAERIEVSLSGGARAELSGSGERLSLSISGGGTGALEDLAVETVDADLSGGSQATVNVSEALDATASGGSTLRYIGDPDIGRENVSGGSAVRPN
jgi:hypothetical protein